MFWVRLVIFSLALLMCTEPALAEGVGRSTDAQGTIHIGNSKAAKSSKPTDAAVEQDAAKAVENYREKSDRLDERGRPRSRRPMNPYARPNLIPGNPYPPTEVRPQTLPGPGGLAKGQQVGQELLLQGDSGFRYTPPPRPKTPVPGGRPGDAASSQTQVPAKEPVPEQKPPGN